MAIVCNCDKGVPCEIHPKPKPVPTGSAPGVVQNPAKPCATCLDPADKLTLKTLEAESLKSQIQMEQQRQQLMARAMATHQQLEQFVAAMFDKHGLKQTEWSLDLGKLEFVAKG